MVLSSRRTDPLSPRHNLLATKNSLSPRRPEMASSFHSPRKMLSTGEHSKIAHRVKRVGKGDPTSSSSEAWYLPLPAHIVGSETSSHNRSHLNMKHSSNKSQTHSSILSTGDSVDDNLQLSNVATAATRMAVVNPSNAARQLLENAAQYAELQALFETVPLAALDKPQQQDSSSLSSSTTLNESSEDRTSCSPSVVLNESPDVLFLRKIRQDAQRVFEERQQNSNHREASLTIAIQQHKNRLQSSRTLQRPSCNFAPSVTHPFILPPPGSTKAATVTSPPAVNDDTSSSESDDGDDDETYDVKKRPPRYDGHIFDIQLPPLNPSSTTPTVSTYSNRRNSLLSAINRPRAVSCDNTPNLTQCKTSLTAQTERIYEAVNEELRLFLDKTNLDDEISKSFLNGLEKSVDERLLRIPDSPAKSQISLEQ